MQAGPRDANVQLQGQAMVAEANESVAAGAST
jgi:hypothetical protein